jgi:hypothetical protein
LLYTWKYHNEIPCIAVLNKQNHLFFFSKTEDRKVKQFYLGVDTSGRGEDIREGCRRVNVVEYYVLMYENGKMRSVENVLRMEEGV